MGGVEGLVDDAPDLLVDLVSDLRAVIGVGAEVPAQEYLVVRVAERQRAQFFRHAVPGDHLLGEFGRPLQIVGCSCGHVA